ncbi:TatD family hydrolase [Patescibacteria group bacterium]
MLIDTHAHVNFNAYKDDGAQVIKRALDNDICMILVGAQYSTSKRAVEYAQKYKKGVYAAIGLHPSHLREQTVKDKNDINFSTKQEVFDLEKYRELAKDKKVVAIGEIGLDYHQTEKEEDKYNQKQVFIEQLDLARQIDKPVIIHCREAYDDLFELLSVFSSGCASCPYACPGAGGGSPLRGVVHCFAGDVEIAKKFLSIGFYIGFTGIITFTEQYNNVIKEIPLDKILIETDCPYLSPVPERGKRNEPSYVRYVAEKIARIKEIDFNKVAEQTTNNAKELFGI